MNTYSLKAFVQGLESEDEVFLQALLEDLKSCETSPYEVRIKDSDGVVYVVAIRDEEEMVESEIVRIKHVSEKFTAPSGRYGLDRSLSNALKNARYECKLQLDLIADNEEGF